MQRLELRSTTQRRAAVIVMIVVVILIIGAMTGQLARRVLMDRRNVREQALHRQTQELLSAGIQRLHLNRTALPDWQGEVWTPVITTESQTNHAEVSITINGSSATVVARYPIHSPTPQQLTRHIELDKQ